MHISRSILFLQSFVARAFKSLMDSQVQLGIHVADVKSHVSVLASHEHTILLSRAVATDLHAAGWEKLDCQGRWIKCINSCPGVASIFDAKIGEWQIILHAKVTIHPQGPRGAVLSLFEAGELNFLKLVYCLQLPFFHFENVMVACLVCLGV